MQKSTKLLNRNNAHDKNSRYRDPLELGHYIRELCADKQDCYVFIDEIEKVYTIVNPNLTNGKHRLAAADDQAGTND